MTTISPASFQLTQRHLSHQRIIVGTPLDDVSTKPSFVLYLVIGDHGFGLIDCGHCLPLGLHNSTAMVHLLNKALSGLQTMLQYASVYIRLFAPDKKSLMQSRCPVLMIQLIAKH